MGVYIFVLLSSTIASYIAYNMNFVVGNGIKTKSFNAFFIGLAVFIPCFFAAVRDSSIGYDISIYGNPAFETALRTSSLASFMKTFGTLEPLYMSLTYICAKFGNIYIYYFMLQFLVICPIWLSLRRIDKGKFVWIGLFIYLCWMYGFSLNIMRQSIAISITLYGYRFIQERKPIKFFFIIFIAMGFHTTAIMACAIYLINVLVVCEERDTSYWRKKFIKYRSVSRMLILMLVTALFAFGSSLISYISEVTGRFVAFSHDLVSFGLEIPNILFMLVILCIIYLGIEKNRSFENNFFLYIIAIGAVVYQLKGMSAQMYRVSMYLTCYMIYCIPLIVANQEKNRFVVKALTMGIFVGYFWFYNVYWMWHSIYPYTSTFLGIS